MNYVLFRLLKFLGHEVNEKYFIPLKTEKTIKEHKEEVTNLLNKIEWNF